MESSQTLKQTYAQASEPYIAHPNEISWTFSSCILDVLEPMVILVPDGRQDLLKTPRTDQGNWKLFRKMSTTTNPGLTEAEFRTLVTKCMGCGLFMTPEVYRFHFCGPEEVTVLTDTED
jgi:hypothetical protein